MTVTKRKTAPVSATPWMPVTNENDPRLVRWRERVAAGEVKNVGTVRLFGTSGDATVQYPMITSLTSVERDQLPDDERAALEWATVVVNTHQRQGRVVSRALPGQPFSNEIITDFDPSAPEILVVSQITGG